eukprot:752157-Hanusia_phi.AAC.4
MVQEYEEELARRRGWICCFPSQKMGQYATDASRRGGDADRLEHEEGEEVQGFSCSQGSRPSTRPPTSLSAESLPPRALLRSEAPARSSAPALAGAAAAAASSAAGAASSAAPAAAAAASSASAAPAASSASAAPAAAAAAPGSWPQGAGPVRATSDNAEASPLPHLTFPRSLESPAL